MPLQATSGAASYDAFGGGVAAVPNYIEDVFSTWLYQSNDSGQTITNGIDLAGEGGLVWTKPRGQSGNHILLDTVRGGGNALYSNTTQATDDIGSGGITSFNSNGYTGGYNLNINNNIAWCSWTFREQPKFFDVVTWTGNNTYRNISHNLGSVPGCIIVKVTNGTSSWIVYHRSLGQSFGADNTLELNTTSASIAGGWGDYANPTTTTFFVPPTAGLNATGETYVAYLFAHNAGGFGLTGTDNVISCGSYTGNGSATGPVINLGYEPQWVMIKNTTTGGLYYDWYIQDSMRGFGVDVESQGGGNLNANTSEAQELGFNPVMPTATGFKIISADVVANKSGDTFIYIAIRRGPMKVPTTGTSVFSPNTQTGAGTSAGQTITTNFPVDLEISSGRANNSGGNYFIDRLRGSQNYMRSNNNAAEVNFTSWTPLVGFANNTGITDANYGSTSSSYVAWNFRRAPSVFDEVCYTGVNPGGATLTVNHNLGVTPELVIIKNRVGVADWFTYSAPTGTSNTLYLNLTTAATAYTLVTSPTASTFVANGVANVDTNTFVAYLFASCPGVSKVGSFTGTGATQTINCGFTTGARFVLIKATSTTGSWYVWDSARGIVSGDDPYLLLNSTANEVTNTDWVDTAASGFELSNAGGNLANSSGVSYIFLAVS
jgi:hypothetical protein